MDRGLCPARRRVGRGSVEQLRRMPRACLAIRANIRPILSVHRQKLSTFALDLRHSARPEPVPCRHLHSRPLPPATFSSIAPAHAPTSSRRRASPTIRNISDSESAELGRISRQLTAGTQCRQLLVARPRSQGTLRALRKVGCLSSSLYEVLMSEPGLLKDQVAIITGAGAQSNSPQGRRI